MKPGLIQIAGVHDSAEAHVVAGAGAHWIGFPLGLDKHAEDLSVDEARRVVEGLPATSLGVLITYVADPGAVVALAEKIGVGIVQLHGAVTAEGARNLRELRPDWTWIKSVVMGRPGDPSPEEQVQSFAPFADAFLTDTFDPTTGASGATGKTHDWRWSRRLVEVSPKPVILAGGLTAENVGEAIRTVRPFGVDAHTGVEGKDGRKCPVKLEAFIREARRAWER